ncbi:hypothetical protein MAR_021215, partial [Mya arenaria]
NPNGSPQLSADEVLLEGEPVNITCTSSSARPPPLLKLFVEDIEIDTNTNVSTTLDDSTGLGKSVSTLHSFKKEWGNKNMSCQQLPEVNGLYHERVSNKVQIYHKYPPSRLDLVMDQGKLSNVITAICTSMFANPACDIKWESTIMNFNYSLLESHTFKHSTALKISFKASNEDYGKRIRCSTECQYFQNTLTNSTNVIFAKLIQSERGSFLWIVVSVIAVVTLGSFVLIVCGCRKRWNRVYENINTHQVRNMYQGIAVTSLNRPTELDETTSPRVYDEIDENNLSMK